MDLISCAEWQMVSHVMIIKGIVYPKVFHCLVVPSLYDFLFWNTIDDILKNVRVQTTLDPLTILKLFFFPTEESQTLGIT